MARTIIETIIEKGNRMLKLPNVFAEGDKVYNGVTERNEQKSTILN